jgi:hypothetical protein
MWGSSEITDIDGGEVKKVLFCGMLVFALLVSLVEVAQAFREGTKPIGFRGIEWGIDISSLKDMVLRPESVIEEVGKERYFVEQDVKHYEKEQDSLTFGTDVILDGVDYGFYKRKFFEGIMWFKGATNYSAALQQITLLFGLSSDLSSDKNDARGPVCWQSVNVWVCVEYNKGTAIGRIRYMNPWMALAAEKTQKFSDKKWKYYGYGKDTIYFAAKHNPADSADDLGIWVRMVHRKSQDRIAQLATLIRLNCQNRTARMTDGTAHLSDGSNQPVTMNKTFALLPGSHMETILGDYCKQGK